MSFPIFKSRDADNVRVYAKETHPGTWMFTHTQGVTVTETYELAGDEAQERLAHYRAADALSFGAYYSSAAPQLAHTGRPSRTPLLGGLALAAVATAAAMSTVLSVATDAQAPSGPYLSDVVTAPVVTPSPTRMTPYRPEPRPTPHTTREGVRKTLAPTPSTRLATPSTKPRTKHPIPTAPADVRISYYRNCSAAPQPCIDAGALTMYAGNILAGHNYMGYQWLSRVLVGRTVRVISGPLAGTYKVYGHMRINRRGGSIPTFPGSPALVLQTCEGSGTGFSLLRRV